MTLFKSPILVLDTETSGFLERDWSRVVEVGAVLVGCDGSELACFESFVLPDILDERADGAFAVNHITREMLVGAPDGATVSEMLHAWIEGLGDPLVGEPFAVRLQRGFRPPHARPYGVVMEPVGVLHHGQGERTHG